MKRAKLKKRKKRSRGLCPESIPTGIAIDFYPRKFLVVHLHNIEA